MRILYIHQYFTTPSLGGGTRSFEFAKRFVAAGHQVTILTGTNFPNPPAELRIPGLKILSVPTRYRNEMTPLQRIAQFARFASASCLQKVGDIDIVLATSTPLTIGIPGISYKASKRAPLVFEVRDLWPEAPIQMGVIHNRFLIAALRNFEKLIYRCSDHIVALSDGMAEGIRNAGVSSEKITVIPNSSDFEIFRSGPVEAEPLIKRGLPARPAVCYAGTLGEVNEIPILLEAARILQKRNSKAQIIVVGDGKYRGEIENETKENPKGNLVYLGPVSKSDVAEIYRACVAGLMLVKPLPVLQTNSSNKFFDLLAAGRPIVTDVRGWIGDLIREHQIGFLVDSGAESLADGIEVAIQNPDLDGMATRSVALARQRFDRDKLALTYLSVLEMTHKKRKR